eukprot:Tbor_TRINITY_DN5495_c0_g1::TRINITY_DN5495_c0_g1_i1::g.24256::m.24256/K03168/topA; DNA topoisomerase I
MLRRTNFQMDRLVLVESPNKCAKIASILQSSVADWTFGKSSLSIAKGNAKGTEFVTVKPTIGHFMTTNDININISSHELVSSVASNSCSEILMPEGTQKGKKTPKSGSKGSSNGKKNKSRTNSSIVLDLPPLPENAPLLSFVPDMEISKDNHSMPAVLDFLKSQKGNIHEIILASDPDREGELIAVHALRYLKKRLPNKGVALPLFSRAYIQAITEEGVLDAMKKRRLNYCDFSLAEAASTRSSMDRIFGWLGSTTMRGVNQEYRSIGRVQTPALILVRNQELNIERAIENHKASFQVQGRVNLSVRSSEDINDAKPQQQLLFSRQVRFNIEGNDNSSDSAKDTPSSTPSAAFDSKESAEMWLKGFSPSVPQSEGLTSLPPAPLAVTILKKPTVTPGKQKAPLPHTMQSIITAANAQLHISSEVVTQALQELFQAGLITYPRTDSTRVDESFVSNVLKPFIEATFGAEEFDNSKQQAAVTVSTTEKKEDDDASNKKKNKKKKEGNIEDAHEAIRPTSIENDPRLPSVLALFSSMVGVTTEPCRAAAVARNDIFMPATLKARDTASNTPQTIKGFHSHSIYAMIYKAAVAAYMVPCQSESVSVTIGVQPSQPTTTVENNNTLMLVSKLTASRVVKKGWRSVAVFDRGGGSAEVLSEGTDDFEDSGTQDSTNQGNAFETLKNLSNYISNKTATADTTSSGPIVAKTKNDGMLSVEDLKVVEKPLVLPKKYTEGTLIQELKHHGVGRPSTYTSILKTLFSRSFIYSDTQGRLHTSLVGQGVVNSAKNVFPALVDVGFTASFEKELDAISVFRKEVPSEVSNGNRKNKKIVSSELVPISDGNDDLGEGNNPLSCYTLSRLVYALQSMIEKAVLKNTLLMFYRNEDIKYRLAKSKANDVTVNTGEGSNNTKSNKAATEEEDEELIFDIRRRDHLVLTTPKIQIQVAVRSAVNSATPFTLNMFTRSLSYTYKSIGVLKMLTMTDDETNSLIPGKRNRAMLLKDGLIRDSVKVNNDDRVREIGVSTNSEKSSPSTINKNTDEVKVTTAKKKSKKSTTSPEGSSESKKTNTFSPDVSATLLSSSRNKDTPSTPIGNAHQANSKPTSTPVKGPPLTTSQVFNPWAGRRY